MPAFLLTVAGQEPLTGTLEVNTLPTMQRLFQVPADGRYIQLKHDYQTALANTIHPYKPRSFDMPTEVPETVALVPMDKETESEHVILTREMSEWMLKVLMIPWPDMSREKAILRWHNLTKNSVCFTDKWGWNYGTVIGDPTKNYADYLYGINLQNPPMRWKKLAMGGNVHRLVDGTSNVIEAVDPDTCLALDPVQLYLDKPWLFSWGVQCYKTWTGVRELIDGQMRLQFACGRFPHWRPVNVLYATFGRGGRIRIKDAWRIKPVTNGAVYSPYIP